MSVLPWVQASPHVAPVGAHVVVTHVLIDFAACWLISLGVYS